MKTLDKEAIIAEYLLAEFSALHQRADQKEQVIANKVNGLLTSVSIIAGALLIVSSNTILSNYFTEIIFLAFIIILLFGTVTFGQILDLRASAQFFYRRAGRIRKWFLDRNPNLQPYIPFIVGDNTPSYLEIESPLRSNEGVVVLLNAFSFFAVIGLTGLISIRELEKITGQPTNAIIILLIGLVCLITIPLSWWLQIQMIQRLLRRRETFDEFNGRVLFPQNRRWYREYQAQKERPLINNSSNADNQENDYQLLQKLLK